MRREVEELTRAEGARERENLQREEERVERDRLEVARRESERVEGVRQTELAASHRRREEELEREAERARQLALEREEWARKRRLEEENRLEESRRLLREEELRHRAAIEAIESVRRESGASKSESEGRVDIVQEVRQREMKVLEGKSKSSSRVGVSEEGSSKQVGNVDIRVLLDFDRARDRDLVYVPFRHGVTKVLAGTFVDRCRTKTSKSPSNLHKKFLIN